MKPVESKIHFFSKPYEELRKAQEAIKQIQKAISPFRDAMRKLSETMDPVIRELPDKSKRLLENLAERGWFLPLLDSTIPAVYHLAKVVESNKEEEINRILVKFYTERLDKVLKRLVATYPDRAHLFQSAFMAHNRKEYDLCIPVLLTQADGVCYELLGEKLFSREQGTGMPKTKKALEKKMGYIRMALP